MPDAKQPALYKIPIIPVGERVFLHISCFIRACGHLSVQPFVSLPVNMSGVLSKPHNPHLSHSFPTMLTSNICDCSPCCIHNRMHGHTLPWPKEHTGCTYKLLWQCVAAT